MTLFEHTCLPIEGTHTFLTTRHTTLEATIAATDLQTLPVIEMNQVHEDTITYVPKQHALRPSIIPSSDAIYTDQPNHALVVRTADCLPILIYHPSGVIAAIHAGRKSTELSILKQTLERLLHHTKTPTDPFYIWFGPHICEPCYQINRDTDEHYSLLSKNLEQLQSVLPKNRYHLVQDGRCTRCENDRFFSYRQEGAKSGRIYSIIYFSHLPSRPIS